MTNIPIPVQLTPIQGKASDRKVWSIPLHGVWLPFFTATNAMGESNIPAEVLGAPLRLATESDGTPKFSKTGHPVLRVVRELSDQVRIVRENIAFGLLAYAGAVQKANPDAYKAQVEASQKAGEPLVQKDANTVADYLTKVKAETAETAEKELVPA